jgi:hypothetical protein
MNKREELEQEIARLENELLSAKWLLAQLTPEPAPVLKPSRKPERVWTGWKFELR